MLYEEIIAALSRRGARITRPRRDIIESIYQLRDGASFTTEDICEWMPKVGRATVYRTIRMLLDADLLCKVVLPDNEMAYSVSPAVASHHHHAICTRCDNVRKFAAESIERAVDAIDDAGGIIGAVRGHRLEIYDLCPACAAAGDAAPR